MPVYYRAGSQLVFPSTRLFAPQQSRKARRRALPSRQAHTFSKTGLVSASCVGVYLPILGPFSTLPRPHLLLPRPNFPNNRAASADPRNGAHPSSQHLVRLLSRTRDQQRAATPGIAARYHSNIATMAASQQATAPAGMDQLISLVDGLSLQTIGEKYPTAHPDRNPMDLYRAHIADVLSSISGVAPEIVLSAIQWTSTLEKGDCVIAVPALRIKDKTKKPDQLAQEWGDKFPDDDPLVRRPTVSSYFMSFFFRGDVLVKGLVPMIRALGAEYGRNPASGLRDPKDPSKGRKRIIVEFSGPNIAKQFHVGHLRSTIIGAFIANLYEACGWTVLRFNYLGDWGKQYGLMALGWERFGDEEALRQNPIDHLFQLYVRINKEKDQEKERIEAARAEGKDVTALEANSLDEQARRYFKKMTDRDESALALWRRFRELSVAKYEEAYARLNIRFDEHRGESLVPEESMEKTAKEMAEKGISKEDQGAIIVDFADHVPGKEGKRLEKAVVRKKDGTALYLTRDISELLNRYEEYHFDHMIYVVASQQDLHLKQLFKIIELLGYKDIAAKCQHINFGLVHGMSTRRGTVKFLDDILNDVGQFMHDNMRKNEVKYQQVEDPDATADILGISAVMCQDMTGKRVNGYHFNMEAMTSFEGDTGPYLQYAHARLRSIERRVALSDEELGAADLSLLTERHAVDMVRMLAQWPDVVETALKTLEPTTILTYLFKMAHVVSSSYDVLQVVGSEPELLRARMALYTTARTVLRNGMELLGLTPLERM